ncbi:MAG TPA: hypothetical protein VG033_10070 [Candidatus Acidoferrales bacterium]|nr:hypothetical protein [Candidatus Acidoferrales bacterium]
MRETPSSFDYLLKCSLTSLEGFELARLNRIANLRKELRDLVEEWVAAEVEARVSRWLLEARRIRKQALLPFGEPTLPFSDSSHLLDAMLAEAGPATPRPFSPADAAIASSPGGSSSRTAVESRTDGLPAAGMPGVGLPGTESPDVELSDFPRVATSHALSRYIFSAHAPPSCLPVMRSRVPGDDSAPAARIRRRQSA